MPEDFFGEQLPGSKIKSRIVSEYFRKWSKVMIPRVRGKGDKLGYLDFFCGPGKYEDGSNSTPLIILNMAVSDNDLSNMLVTVFNDKDEQSVNKLEEEVGEIDGIEKLKYKPSFRQDTVGQELANIYKEKEIIPSLIFIDPFGYKGLSLDLIASTIKDWGCDCIFFFNYNRINAAITNSYMKEHVDSIFGRDAAELLRQKVPVLNPDERERLILDCFSAQLKKVKGEFSISFKFYQEDGSKTSHFIFFVSKHPLAYHLMKETMANCCKWRGGVPSYEYNPAVDRYYGNDLFSEINYGIEELAEKLLVIFKGKITDRKMVYEEHNIGTPYVENNYKDALLLLESQGRISVDPPLTKRRKYRGLPTLGENIKITFN